MLFNTEQLKIISSAVEIAEETIAQHWKFSERHPFLKKFEIKTQKDLIPAEYVENQFAQILAFDTVPKNGMLKSQEFTWYKICLQDNCILSFLAKNPDFDFFALILYIITHELIHLVRFSSFKSLYSKLNEQLVQKEEGKVHTLTYELLEPLTISSLQPIFDFYRKWRDLK